MQYPTLHTYAKLKTEFLRTFRRQPIAAHILNSLQNIKQSGRSVHVYASKIRKLVNQLERTEWPSDLI